MTTLNSPRDCCGRPILVGDTICYPGRVGSDMWLRVAKVVAVRTDSLPMYLEIDPKASADGRFKDSFSALLTRWDRCCILWSEEEESEPQEG